MKSMHPGFKKVADMISRKSGGNGAAILAASSRNASDKAKKKNPMLLKVKG